MELPPSHLSVFAVRSRTPASELRPREENAEAETTTQKSHGHNASSASDRSALQFITITDPNQSGAATNRKLVRAQAMRHARQSVWKRTEPVSSASGETSESSPPSSTRSPPAPGNIDLPAEAYEGSFQVNISSSHDSASASSSQADNEVLPYWAETANPLTPLGAGRVDPFKSSRTEMKPYMHFLIDHYAHVVGPSHMPIGGVRSPLVTEFLPLARESPTFFHCLLTVTASHITVEKGIQVPQYIESYHRGEACRLLGDSLSDPRHATSDVIIASILILSGFEVLFGLDEAHEAHMRGLDRIIAVRGGLDNLGYKGLLRMLITWAHHFRAQREQKSAQLTFGPHPSTDSPASTTDSHTSTSSDVEAALPVPIGFQETHNMGIIGNKLIKPIETLWALTFIVDDPPDPTVDNLTSINKRRMKVEEQLEKIHRSFSGVPKHNVEECCCLALLLYDHTILRKMPRGAAIHIEQSVALRLALERTRLDAAVWGTDRKILLWILFIGFVANPNLSSRYWFASHVQEIISWSQPSLEVEDVREFLKSFLWCETGHAQPFEELMSLMIKNPADYNNYGYAH